MPDWKDNIPFPSIVENALKRIWEDPHLPDSKPEIYELRLSNFMLRGNLERLKTRNMLLEDSIKQLEEKVKFFEQDISVKNSVINRLKNVKG